MYTTNGFNVNFFPPVAEGQRPLTARAQQWAVEALEACTFDPARLDSSTAIEELGPDSGWTFLHSINVYGIVPEGIPDFGQDFATIEGPAGGVGGQFFAMNIFVWFELDSAGAPFGGRRFFKETILHALGHHVGERLGYSTDAWKRLQCTLALTDHLDPGTAVAWGDWEDDYNNSLPWAERPKERFAETFKDIFGNRTARRFSDRTGWRTTQAEVIFDECTSYLPIRGLNYADVQSTPLGALMREDPLPAGSLGGTCYGGAFLCQDPCSGALYPCAPCIAGGTGVCASSFSYPCAGDITNLRWGIGVVVPKCRLCKEVTISVDPYIAVEGGFVGGSCGVTPPELIATLSGSAFEVDRRWGGAFEGGPRNDIIGQSASAYGGQLHSRQQARPYLTVNLRLPPEETGELLPREQAPRSINRSNVALYMDGFVQSPVPAQQNNMADEKPVGATGRYFIHGAYRMLCPSEGTFTDPYTQFHVEAIDAGARATARTSGLESSAPDLQARTHAIAGVKGSLRVEGQ